MTQRSGLGFVEVAVLETLHRIGARPDRPHHKSATALVHLDESFGIAPDYGYAALCDLARPWLVHLRCVDFHGNVGSPDFPEASPRYTEARLSPIGLLGLAAEHGEVGPVPIGLINGNTYCGGSRPPYDPRRVVEALMRLAGDPSLGDDELVDLVGAPSFPTKCEVNGELEAMTAGELATLRLTARFQPAPAPQRGWLLDRLPPGVGVGQVEHYVSSNIERRRWTDELPELDLQTRLPVTNITNLSAGDTVCLAVTAAPDADLDVLRDRLVEVWGVSIELRVRLPASLPEVLRRWVSQHGDEDLNVSLGRLGDLHDGG